jgi:hypothetical protein
LSVPSYPTHYNPLLVTNSTILLINESSVVDEREFLPSEKPRFYLVFGE